MAGDEAVLTAQVYDAFSEPIRKMQRQLRQLSEIGASAAVTG
jgi:hypothetical protein